MNSNEYSESQLIHGGQLEKQVQKYRISREQWLDLSTGISPYSYPTDNIPKSYWHRLPEITQSFSDAVSNYYGCSNFLACSGSQAAIQVVPKLCKESHFKSAKVWLPEIGYKEHQKHWQRNNFSVVPYTQLPSKDQLSLNCIVVVINPNNPTGETYDPSILLDLASQLQEVNGLLIVDEAFIETNRQNSITVKAEEFKNLVVMRSLGKFFGLAGARLGFVFASNAWLDKLRRELGEWPVAGPTLFLAEAALSDKQWQFLQTSKLKKQSELLGKLLNTFFQVTPTGTLLFQTVQVASAQGVFEMLCQQGIYVRLTDDKKALRFGIPDSIGFLRLKKALSKIAVDSEDNGAKYDI